MTAELSAWSDARSSLTSARLLGIGYWVQGFRSFPWLAMEFFLKDGLNVTPSTFQLIRNFAKLPLISKPIYGVVSDAFYIRGAHRLPYIVIGVVLQAISWLVIAFMPYSHLTIFNLSILLLLGYFGAAICEVANDAIVAETAKQASGHLQSFVWMCDSFGSALGSLLCGVAVDKFGARSIFSVFALILTIQFAVTVSVSEQSLNLPKEHASSAQSSSIRRRVSRGQFLLSTDVISNSHNSSSKGVPPRSSTVTEQLYKLQDALQIPDVLRSLCWFAASYAVVPLLVSTKFYYQTEHLNLNSSVIGLSKVVGQLALLAWGVVYDKWMKNVSPRLLISALQAMVALLMVLDVFFVNGGHRWIGSSDSAYVVVFSGVLEVLPQFKELPFSVLMAQLCPPGCEGSLMAFVRSTASFSVIISGYLGVALASSLDISGDDFSSLTQGIMVQAACAIIPLFWSSWICDGSPAKKQE